jgi:TRAP-type transport system small permease protein
MRGWIRFGNLVERMTNVATAALTCMMAIVVCWQVVARYVFNTGQFWAEEFAVICMFWLALIGAAGALWSGDHIGLHILVRRLPAKLRDGAQALTELLVGAFAVFLAIQGVELVVRTSGGDWSALRVPLGYTYAVLPFSAALMAMLGLTKGVLRFVALFAGGELPDSWATEDRSE